MQALNLSLVYISLRQPECIVISFVAGASMIAPGCHARCGVLVKSSGR